MGVSGLIQAFHAYINEARRLQKKYRGDQIQLIIGLESEWIDPSYAHEIQMLRSIYHLDLIVGSLHHVHGIPIDFSSDLYQKARHHIKSLMKQPKLANVSEEQVSNALFQAYFDAQYEMLTALKPEVVGHFDLIRMYDPSTPLDSNTLARMRRNVKFVVEYGGLFELNSRGFKKGLKGYPLLETLRMIKECGGRFTLSDDAHAPNEVGLFYKEAVEYLSQEGIDSVYYWMPRVVDETQEADEVLTQVPSVELARMKISDLQTHVSQTMSL